MYGNSVEISHGKTDRRDAGLIESLQSKHASLESENSKLRSELEKMQGLQGTSLLPHSDAVLQPP
jgi:hypothetical protein